MNDISDLDQTDRVAIVHSPETKAYLAFLPEIERVSPSLGIRVTAAGVADDAAEIERVITAHGREAGGGLIVLPHSITTRYRQLIIELTSKHRLPAIYPYRYFAAEGGLISYGIDGLHLSRQAAASYVDRILNGTKPADLPVQQPTKFELVVNLKTAKALGLEVPPTLLARADEVIE
jgi:putative ABC transport system substrate-binding protein